jgi:hypothetical protein
MDNVFKGIFVAGVTNLVTGNLVIALSIGWFAYFYLKQKERQNDTIN